MAILARANTTFNELMNECRDLMESPTPCHPLDISHPRASSLKSPPVSMHVCSSFVGIAHTKHRPQSQPAGSLSKYQELIVLFFTFTAAGGDRPESDVTTTTTSFQNAPPCRGGQTDGGRRRRVIRGRKTW